MSPLEVIQIIRIIALGISILLSFLAFMFLLWMRVREKELGRLPSVTMSFWMVVSVFLYCIASLMLINFTTNPNIIPPARVIAGYLSLSGTLLTLNSITVLAIDLHITFLITRSVNKTLIRKFYEPVVVVISFLCGLPLLISVKPVFDPARGMWIMGPVYLKLFQVLGIWTSIEVLYCFLISAIVIVKLILIKRSQSYISSANTNSNSQISRVVSRIVLYPLIPVFCYTVFVIAFSTLR